MTSALPAKIWRVSPPTRVGAGSDSAIGAPGAMLAPSGIWPAASVRLSTLRARVSIRTCLVRAAKPNMTSTAGFSRAISAGSS